MLKVSATNQRKLHKLKKQATREMNVVEVCSSEKGRWFVVEESEKGLEREFYNI